MQNKRRQNKRRLRVIHTPKKRFAAKKLLYAGLLAAAVFLLLQAGYTYIRSVIAARFVNIVVSEADVLETGHKVRGIIVRDEMVAAAPITGMLHWEVTEGTRLAAGAAAAYITAGDGARHAVLTPRPGIVVLYLDGLEGMLQPQNLSALNVEDMYEYAGQPGRRQTAGAVVQQGSMLFKVVDNFTWYFALELSDEEYAAMAEENIFYLRFPFAPQNDVLARRLNVYEEAGLNRIIFELGDNLPGFLTERFSAAEIIIQTRGMVLPITALVRREEEKGVYVLEKSVVRFRPVEVLNATEKEMAVSGIQLGAKVVTNPLLVREGMRI